MEKISREKTIYENIFVSKDGKEFNTAEACRAWEDSYSGTLRASWKLIKQTEINPCNIGIPYSYEDKECYVIKPKNLEEITLVNAYLRDRTGSNCGMLTTKHIDKLVALDFGYDGDYCEVYILEDHIKSITDYVTELENEMQGTTVEENN